MDWSHRCDRKCPDAAWMRKVAAEREFLHRNHQSSRPLSPDYEYIGLMGELAFHKVTGEVVDLLPRPEGDGAVDYRIGRYHIDVKTARKPGNMLREAGKRSVSDILVLARYSDKTDEATLLGWEWDDNMLRAPRKDFGYGVVNHFVPVYKLKQMWHLWMLLQYG
jgi:hypothetical protein